MKTNCGLVAAICTEVAFLASVAVVTGFEVIRQQHPPRATILRPAPEDRRGARTTSLRATVYFPSDWVEDEDDSTTTVTAAAPAGAIPEVLSTQAWTAPLARLAAGHWDGGGLQIEQIEQVSVRAVAPSHVDIEAIVCEDDGCVSLSVPVPFAQSCGGSFGSKFEECILRNMQLLDDEQIEAIDGAETEEEAIEALRSTVDVEYPKWWVEPRTMAFARECNTLMNILNEPDFQSDLLGVIRNEMKLLLGSDDGIDLQNAAVVAVGPAGMVLHAYALYNGETEMVPVPVAFVSTVMDVTKMRDAVLDCVEGVYPAASP